MNKTTKINILAYASEPDKNYEYDGDIVDYKGKKVFRKSGGRASEIYRDY